MKRQSVYKLNKHSKRYKYNRKETFTAFIKRITLELNKQIERDIEDDFVLYARTCCVDAIKFIDPSDTGAPDRMCLWPPGKIIFIEFKKPNEKANPKQAQYHKRLKALGFDVYVCDSLDKAIKVLNNAIQCLA